ncbi:hypothetical protein IZV00_07175 [Sphingobium sp. Cam5-1]|nr:hypothetical protein IZV00_07175 [Sphingobium sp. Cam5-1]
MSEIHPFSSFQRKLESRETGRRPIVRDASFRWHDDWNEVGFSLQYRPSTY